MVPLRAVVAAFGYNVSWDGKSATITGAANKFVITPGVIEVNGKNLEAAPEVKESKLYVPISFIEKDCGISYVVNGDSSITFSKTLN